MVRCTRSASVIILALTAAALTLVWSPFGEVAAQSADEIARPVKTVVVEAEAATVRRVYPAVVLPAQEAELSFRVFGQIVDLPIRGALQVAEGTLVAQLDTRDFEAELAQLTSQLAQAEALLQGLTSGARPEDLAALEADVAAARAQFDAAENAANRSRALFERNVIARVKLDQDVSALQIAEAALEGKRQMLRKARSGAP